MFAVQTVLVICLFVNGGLSFPMLFASVGPIPRLLRLHFNAFHNNFNNFHNYKQPQHSNLFDISRKLPLPLQTQANSFLAKEYEQRDPLMESGVPPVEGNVISEADPLQFSTDDIKDEKSDLHPVYVLPPPHFQPVIYPSSRIDGVNSGFSGAVRNPTIRPPLHYPPSPVQQLPFRYPLGVTSWSLGGIRSVVRGGYWERLGNDLALQPQPNLVVYLKRPTPVNSHKQTSSGEVWRNEVPETPAEDTQDTRSRLPVGLSSWFLGGIRDLTGRHWNMPKHLVEKVEFMPASATEPPLDEDERNKNEYLPVEPYHVDFDDAIEYNIIKETDQK